MDKTLQHNGVEMAYRVEGEGSPVILMHGWGCSRETVASIERVALRGHRVYNVDFPGFGKSEEPPAIPGSSEPWGVDMYARMIEELIRQEDIAGATLIGHSFGGRVAIVVASRRDDIAKVVLVDAAGIKPRRGLRYYVKVYSFKGAKMVWRLLVGKERAAERIEQMRRRRGSADYGASSPMMRRVLSRVVNEDLKHLMPLIKAPTLLIWGSDDTACPLRDARKMERLIPDAGLVSFEGCGHYCFLDNPGGFAAVLDNFINHGE